ncbi:hypothetical protein Pelo_5456 [Pelomyxa schiedti]|nr:hypothetical protein Pelo_5456 [Pelomyxa schiedti]
MEPSNKRPRTNPQSQPQSPAPSESKPSPSELVSATAASALVHIERLAADAEENARKAELDFDAKLSQIRREVMDILDTRIGGLRAQIHSNLDSSLTKLKTFNSAGYTGEQRLFCPRERLLEMFRTECEGISIIRGKHILDLPMSVLSQIVAYLPPESVVAIRTVCLLFWDVVRTVYGCRRMTITRQVHQQDVAMKWWKVIGDTLVAPCMDFQVRVSVKKESRKVGVYFNVSKKKLYAQPTTLAIGISYGGSGNNNTLELEHIFFSTSDLAEISSGNLRRIYCDWTIGPDSPMPLSTMDLTVTVMDEYDFDDRPSRINDPPCSWNYCSVQASVGKI